MRRRNPIVVHDRGRFATQSMGGMPLEESDYRRIEARHDGKVIGSVDLLYDVESGQATIELLEVPAAVRNKGNVLVPLMREAFRQAKKLGASVITTEACWRGVYRFALRFQAPDIVRSNGLMSRDVKECSYFKQETRLPLDQIPDINRMKNYSDAETGRMAPFYETGHKAGDFFNDSRTVFRRESVSATDDLKNVIRRIAGVAIETNWKTYQSKLVEVPQSDPASFTKFLPETSPLDRGGVDTTKLPMLRIWWYL